MYQFDPMKKCVICGYLAFLVMTYAGAACEKCLKRLHKEYHLPEGFYYDFPLDDYNSRSAIEATTSGVVSSPTFYIDFNK